MLEKARSPHPFRRRSAHRPPHHARPLLPPERVLTGAPPPALPLFPDLRPRSTVRPRRPEDQTRKRGARRELRGAPFTAHSHCRCAAALLHLAPVGLGPPPEPRRGVAWSSAFCGFGAYAGGDPPAGEGDRGRGGGQGPPAGGGENTRCEAGHGRGAAAGAASLSHLSSGGVFFRGPASCVREFWCLFSQDEILDEKVEAPEPIMKLVSYKSTIPAFFSLIAVNLRRC